MYLSSDRASFTAPIDLVLPTLMGPARTGKITELRIGKIGNRRTLGESDIKTSYKSEKYNHVLYPSKDMTSEKQRDVENR